MKQILKNILVCPICQARLEISTTEALVCTKCESSYSMLHGIPIFSPVSSSINPSNKIERSAESGTHWRQANWKFIEQQIADLPPETLILDVGAGRGDFSQLFMDFQYIALDIYPYPEIDIVCDISQHTPFLEDTFDRVVLLNVCEHIYDPRVVFSSIFRVLKPGGKVIITIPFLLKIHQAPVDFARYTHFALQKMGIDAGFEIERIEGFYDPAGVMEEATRYYRFWEIPKLNRFQRIIARLLLSFISFNIHLLEILSGKGRVKDPYHYDFPAPSGFHLVFCKPVGGSPR